MAPKPGPTPQDIGSDLFKIIKLIKERKYDPVIVFSFSRRYASVLQPMYACYTACHICLRCDLYLHMHYRD